MDNHLRTATFVAELLDNKFEIMGIHFGIDPILGIIPGFGDIVSLFLSLYLVWIGLQMRIPEHEISRMIQNSVLDFVLGILPVVGDITDLVYKSNIKNLAILRKYAQGRVVEGKIIK